MVKRILKKHSENDFYSSAHAKRLATQVANEMTNDSFCSKIACENVIFESQISFRIALKLFCMTTHCLMYSESAFSMILQARENSKYAKGFRVEKTTLITKLKAIIISPST